MTMNKWPYFYQRLTGNMYTTNNIISAIVTDSARAISNNQSYNSIFEYNTSDYPIKEIRTYLNGWSKNYFYEYSYK